MDDSIRYWHEGVGLDLLMDGAFDGDWPTLFGSASTSLRSAFLGDPAGEGGVVELVDLGGAPARCDPVDPPPVGFMLVAFQCPVDPVLARLVALGYPGPRRDVTIPSHRGPVRIALMEDPNGVRFELSEFVDP